MKKLYLDTSVVVKRYVEEKGSDLAGEIYRRSDTKELSITFSMRNVGEAIGVMDQYRRRGWISEDQFRSALSNLAGEALRLLRIETLELLAVDSSQLADTWDHISRHHICQGNALQLVGCARSEADALVSADKALLEIARREGVAAVDIESQTEVSELL